MGVVIISGETLSDLLARRDDPMAACEELEWLSGFAEIPVEAAAPLAMSGPHPRAVGSYGADCIAWARRELRVTPRWWQALAITRQLEHDDDGRLVWREVVETGPRRVGKSVRLRVAALWRIAHAARFGEQQLSMLVSKDLAVGKEIHRGAWRWAERKGWTVTRLGGAQEVESADGDRWLLRAPDSAYGYDVGYGQVDEAWGVDPQAITDGIEPALLERESPQLHLTSTAHVKASSLMRRRLSTALRGVDQDVLLLMWGAHPDADWADESVWRASSSHWSQARRDLMARKYIAAVAGQGEPEFDDPDPLRGWAAQYLNAWPLLLDHGQSMFPTWSDLETPRAAPPTRAAVVVDVAPDRTGAAVGVAGATGAGRVLVMCRWQPGARTAWIVDQIADLQDQGKAAEVCLTPGQAEMLAPALREAGIEFEVLRSAQMSASCAAFQEAVKAKQVAHLGQSELDLAVAKARTRYREEREIWDRRDPGVDISPLVACAAAAYRWSLLDGPITFHRPSKLGPARQPARRGVPDQITIG